MNLNEFAREVTEDEGLKVSINIGQVKEVQRITFQKMADMSVVEIAEILKKYQKR